MKKIVILILVISIFIPSFGIQGYEFIDTENEELVNEMITEIYDSRQQYEDLAGNLNVDAIQTHNFLTDSYWWPVGSLETTEKNGKLFASGEPSSTNITSVFNAKEDFRTSVHTGVDISSSNGVNYDNVIASKSGVVIYPTSENQIKYEDNGYYGNSDGGGYGNYIIIQHSDGKYTLYAHLAQNSITVLAGDAVEQGQVIAKIGHSGSSTGPHLHFEIRTDSAPGTQIDPLKYISSDNPRPIGVATDGFSLITTTLTKDEFVFKMNDFCTRTNNKDFCNNFASKAEEIYDTSIEHNINPELVVVTAGTEQGWRNCGTTNNFWGIGISNGKGCNAGPHYSSISDGIVGYANVISSYMPGGSKSAFIEQRYKERLAAGADPNGIGLPGTYVGMQMIYSYLGTHIPGSSGSGGYYYMDPDVAGVTTIYSTHEEFLEKCYNAGGEHSAGKPVTAWEQSRYTIFQMEGKNSIRKKIFGI